MKLQHPFLPLLCLLGVFLAACDKSVEVLPSAAPPDSVSERDTIRGAGTATLMLGKGEASGFVILPDSGVHYWVTMKHVLDGRSAWTDTKKHGLSIVLEPPEGFYSSFFSEGEDSLFIQARSSSPIHIALNSTSDSIGAINVSVGIDSAATDSFETDDVPGEAKTLQPDGGKQHRMSNGFGEDDWVKIPVTEGRAYTVGIDVEGYTKYQPITLTLYDIDVVPLAPTHEGELDSTRTILVSNSGQEVALPPVRKGEYLFAKVARKAWGRTLYSIHARCDSARSDFFEPDSTIDQAATIPTDGKAIWRYLGKVDVDWFRFQTRKGKHYTIHSGVGRSVAIYVDSSTSAGGRLRDFVAAKDGTAFLETSSDAPLADTDPGSYFVSVTEDDNVGDSFEPNDRPAQATTLQLDAPAQQHHLGLYGEDFFRLAVSEGQLYQIRIVGANQMGEVEIQLAKSGDPLSGLFDSFDPSIRTFQKRPVISYWATGTGTEFLRIRSKDASDTGIYTIQIVRDSAKQIVVNGQSQGGGCGTGGEVDWFRFQADSGMGYRVVSDLGLAIYQGSPYAKGERNKVLVARKSGSIFLEVDSAYCRDGKRTGSVSVVIDTANIDKYEPDDDGSWDSLPFIATDGTPQYRSIREGDVDRVRLLADSGVTYTLEAIFTGDTTKRFDGYIQSVTIGSFETPKGDWSPGSFQTPISQTTTMLACDKGTCSTTVAGYPNRSHTVVLGEDIMGRRTGHYQGPYTLRVKKQ